MFKKITTICVGNICRSPMVEGLLIQAARDNGKEIQIDSAGLEAMVGHPADPISRELVQSMKIDISDHRARQLSKEILQDTDLVLVMESWQKDEVIARYPETRGKVFNLGHWIGLEIEDPYKQPRVAYAEALGKIKTSTDSWGKKLWQ
jgi:protein-tyrosine phosphatase